MSGLEIGVMTGAIVLVVFTVVFNIIRRKRGKSSCGCDGCSSASSGSKSAKDKKGSAGASCGSRCAGCPYSSGCGSIAGRDDD